MPGSITPQSLQMKVCWVS